MFLLVVVILIAAFLGFVVFILLMQAVRRAATRHDGPAGTDFSVAELHAMLSAGQLTPEEFERARRSILSRERASAALPPPPRERGFEVVLPTDRGDGAGQVQ